MPVNENGNVFEIRTRLCKKTDGTLDHGPYMIDHRLETVECGTCGERLNASTVLAQFARWEAFIAKKKKQAEEAIRANFTRCEHCHRTTKVIR